LFGGCQTGYSNETLPNVLQAEVASLSPNPYCCHFLLLFLYAYSTILPADRRRVDCKYVTFNAAYSSELFVNVQAE